MASYNKVILVGNLTRDPEVKFTPKGTALTDIGLAVNRTYSTDSGEKREEVTFIDVTLWGRTAEIVGQYCRKGRPLLVEGRLQLDTWDDKQSGQKRSKLKVIGENIQLLGSSGAQGQSAGPEEPAGGAPSPASAPLPSTIERPRRPAAPPMQKDADLDRPEDDIPF